MAGGGTALLNIMNKVAALEAEGDEKTGIKIVVKALEEPLRQIAHNAGMEGSVVVEKVKGLEAGTGYNALTGEYENMMEAGIIDPVKVTRSALQNAASIAAMLLTTETVITEVPQEEAMPPMPAGGMGGMM